MPHDFAGLDDLRTGLEAAGWVIYPNCLGRPENLCNWIACKKHESGLPDCLCNGKPPGFVITPWHLEVRGHEARSAEVSMTGDAAEWFKLAAYNINADECIERLPAILHKLAAAWRAVNGV